jgi:hypothetical protein
MLLIFKTRKRGELRRDSKCRHGIRIFYFSLSGMQFECEEMRNLVPGRKRNWDFQSGRYVQFAAQMSPYDRIF